MIDRRELIQRAAVLLGGAVSASAMAGVLAGCVSTPPTAGDKQTFFTAAEMKTATAAADQILPRTDTPGARDVGVPAFIDVILKDAYPADDQARFVSGLKDFDAEAQRAHGKPFLELPQAQRLAFLQKVHDEAAVAERKQADNEVPPSERNRPFVLMMKELTMLGFFVSKPGATQVLQYVAVPGGFQACIPLAQAGNGKQWATETSLRF